MAAVAKANLGLFLDCVKDDPNLIKHEAFDPIRRGFKDAVEFRVTANLSSNRTYVAEQMGKLGVGPVATTRATARPTPDAVPAVP